MDLHPYDGVTRRFRHDDDLPIAPLELISRILGATPPPESLLYDLSFYSGGIGIIDQLRITAEMDAAPLVADWVHWRDAGEEIRDLSDGEVRQFVASHKADFQPPLDHEDVWFSPESGVNSWELIYVEGGRLHYLAFDQG